jgi:hypothetical protein
MLRVLFDRRFTSGARKGFERYQAKDLTKASESNVQQDGAEKLIRTASTFSYDGRKYCSQMTSCAVADYFLRNCPSVKMDGNNDGVSCEQQWCTR